MNELERIESDTESASNIPSTAAVFTDRVQVRTYECDALGHVNNAVYLQYMQQATLKALDMIEDAAFWSARRLTIEYNTPARYGDDLQIATWVLDADELHVIRGYHITRTADGESVARAQLDWDYRDRETHSLRNVPEKYRGVPAVDGLAPLKPFVAPHDNGARVFRWRHKVYFYEIDSTARVGLAAYFQWLEAAFFNATGSVGWTLAKMRAENFISLQYRHDAEFFDAAVNGDEIEIRSRLIGFRRVRGTWLHEVYRATTNTLIMRDYSIGAFLDWEGNVRAGPLEVLEKLTRGESTEAT